jgi:hypothetical protein
MKYLNLFPVLLLLTQQADAQSPAAQPTSYWMVSAGFGMLFPPNPGSPLTTSFQYTSTSVTTGATATQTFTGKTGAFHSPAFAGDMLLVTHVFNHNSINLGFGYNADISGTGLNSYIKAGYGYIFRLGRLQVQPSVDFYAMLDGPANLGTIDNSGVDLSLLGYAAHAQFYSTTFNATTFQSEAHTYNADNLEIDYYRVSYLAEPKLVLGTILWRKMYIGVEGGWLLQMAQAGRFDLRQNGGGTSNVVGKVYVNDHGSLGGPGVGINIGYCFGGSVSKKKKH